jgi:uncharacterized membrane protein YfcA
MNEIFILITAGIFVGVLVGMFGIGGGIIIVPVITFILIGFHNYSFNDALITGIATSLASIIFSGFVSTFSHHINKNIDWYIVRKFFFGVALGSTLVGFYLPQFPINFIRYTFAFYTFFAAYKILFPQQVFKKKLPAHFIHSNLIGLCFASISGLIGIGGGTLFVPYLNSKNISMKLSIGVASCLGLFIGLCSSITMLLSWGLASPNNKVLMLGPIYMPAIVFLTLPSLIFIKLSIEWLQKISDASLRRGFACFLIFIGFMMILKH